MRKTIKKIRDFKEKSEIINKIIIGRIQNPNSFECSKNLYYCIIKLVIWKAGH